MADPTAKVRRGVMERDGERCVSCGTAWGLTFQHRRAVGMGGSKKRPTYDDGLAACGPCNARFEADLQDQALLNGWKVKRSVTEPSRVPYFHAAEGRWYRLTPSGPWRLHVPEPVALELMRDVYGQGFLRGGGG